MQISDIKIGDPVTVNGVPCIVRAITTKKVQLVQYPWYGNDALNHLECDDVISTATWFRWSLVRPINLLNTIRHDTRFVESKCSLGGSEYNSLSWKMLDFTINVIPSPKFVDTAFVMAWRNRGCYDKNLDSYICKPCSYLHEFYHVIQDIRAQYCSFRIVEDVDKFNPFATSTNYLQLYDKDSKRLKGIS